MMLNSHTLLSSVAALSLSIFLTSAVMAAPSGLPPTPAVAAFKLSDVRLLPGPFEQAMRLDEKYLLALDTNRLLAGFRANAGLPEKAKRYGGWESRGLEGHSLGHYLSGCSMMYAATGDAELRERVNYAVQELAECQARSNDGFLAGMPDGHAVFDAIASGGNGAKGGFDLHGAWVPWYNQHKLFAGLRDAYLYTGNEQAKQVLTRLGDWAISVCGHLNDQQMQSMLAVEHGGMMETLADLYAITGDKKYLAISERFWHKAILDPLAAGKDDLTGKHANTQVPKVIGAARLYELTGEPRFKAAAETFWNEVVNKRSFVTGSNSDREHFFALGAEASKLGPENGETCNVYNMLKLTGHLASWGGEAGYYDFYERALFNHILGSIDPQTGMTTYFQALDPGRFKVYGTPDNSFWCCTGTGMENHARYGADIYSHSADGNTLDVNLFLASELKWKDKGLVLRQETKFPEAETTTLMLTLDRPTRLAIRVRVPAWAADGIDVTGSATAHGKPADGFAVLDRTWQSGDQITVRLPMKLALHQAIDDPTMAAVTYGPIVLAAKLGRDDFPGTDNVPVHTVYDHSEVPATPVILSDHPESLTWLRPVDGQPLCFSTAGVGKPADFTLAPFYAIHHERYAVYQRLMTSAQYAERQKQLDAAQQAARELAARTVDEVVFGEQQPEQDHAVQSKNSRTGVFNNKPWRDATSGGSFSAKVKVRPNTNQILRCTYWGGDANRTFDVLCNGKIIGTQTLNGTPRDKFFTADYRLDSALVGTASTATLEFRPHEGSIAGGVFGCLILVDNAGAPEAR